MKYAAIVLAGSLLLPSATLAQEEVFAEVGVSLASAFVLNSERSTVAALGVPGVGMPRHLPPPSTSWFFVSFFPSQKVMFEPSISISGGSGDTTLIVRSQIAFLMAPASQSASYLGVNLRYISIPAGWTDIDDFTVGASYGHRWVVNELFVLRFEVGLNRQIDAKVNEIGLNFAVGGIIPKKR